MGKRSRAGLFGLVALTALAVSVLLLMASAASSGTLTCKTTLTGTIYNDVTVPAGAECTLDGATVKGTVNVTGTGASLIAKNGAKITGNLNANGSGNVLVTGTTINGDVTFAKVVGPKSFVCGSTVGGNVTVSHSSGQIKIGDETEYTEPRVFEVEECDSATIVWGNVTFNNNTADVLQLAGSTVKKNVRVNNNMPGPEEGELDLAANRVSLNFTCLNNVVKFDPTDEDTGPLFDISGNTVGGNFKCDKPAGLP
jgi:hypothetical protein